MRVAPPVLERTNWPRSAGSLRVREKSEILQEKALVIKQNGRSQRRCYSAGTSRAVNRGTEMPPPTVAEPDHLARGGVTRRR